MKDRGSKWSKIALILTNRTEHSIKNRFFGILSKFIDMPQKKMKTELNYLSQNFLNSIISKYMTSIIKKEDYIDYFPIQNSNSEQKTIKENYSYLPHPEEQQSILSENKEEKTVISENLDIFKYINFERGNTKIFY